MASLVTEILNDNPVGYWRLNESGGNIIDQVSGGTDGTVVGTVTRSLQGRHDDACGFDGATGYVDFGTIHQFTTNFSAEAWIYIPTGVGISGQPVIMGVGDLGWFLRIEDSEEVPRVIVYDGTSWDGTGVTDVPQIQRDTWTHVAFSFDGTDIRLYVDGVHVKTGNAPITINQPNTGFYIGADSEQGPRRFFEGRIADVAVYDYVVSEERFAAHAAAYGPAPGQNGYEYGIYYDAPIAYWRLNESSGASTAVDRMGNYDASVTGATSGVTGRIGNAYSFDGTNDYLDIPSLSNFSSTSLTVEAWIKPQFGGAVPADAVVLSKGNNNVHTHFELKTIADSKLTFRGRILGSSGAVSTTTIQDNTWYHVVGTTDSNTWNIYINGILEHSDTYDGWRPNTETFSIGSIFASGLGFIQHWQGLIDEVVIYDYELSADRVADHYRIGSVNYQPLFSGGDITYEDGWVYHTFTSSGTLTPVSGVNAVEVEALVVAGGGGGGSSDVTSNPSGGGGAGGFITQTVLISEIQEIIIGAGGSSNTSGTNSSIGSLAVANGGGRGGGAGSSEAADGGSGGGAGGASGSARPFGAGIVGQGNDGGGMVMDEDESGGGGGGAGSVGGDGSPTAGGLGGAGLEWPTGSGIYYAGGGGGSSEVGTQGTGGIGGGGDVGSAGTANTGGGGGAANPGGGAGAAGGSGIVIIRYRPAILKGGTISTDGTYIYHTFDQSGFIEPHDYYGIDAEALIVAGGGGGGAAADRTGGGGGAGGLVAQQIGISDTHAVTIGAGGASSLPGSDSSVGSLASAIGGGHGGNDIISSTSGGSGGGTYHNNTEEPNPGSGTVGQGNDGGTGYDGGAPGPFAAGGGGGAGLVGGTGNASIAGAGGNGLEWPTGSGNYYAGGGAGGFQYVSGGPFTAASGGVGGGGSGGLSQDDVSVEVIPTAGTANTGGGGGGSAQISFEHSTSTDGGVGGSGISILRYDPQYAYATDYVSSGSGDPPPATGQLFDGGTYTVVDGYAYHTFLESGTLTPISSGGTVEYLVVAGGGGGAGGHGEGGGGGAGGFLSGTIDIHLPQTITVGGGGAGDVYVGGQGSGSSIGSLVVATGGGGGGGSPHGIATSGGSGGGGRENGGAGASGIAGQGNDGGDGASGDNGGCGGGGGAGAPGQDGVSISQAGNGGAGLEWPTGSGNYYAGGGGGGINAPTVAGLGGIGGGGDGAGGTNNATSGAPNTGGGGGGSNNNSRGSGGSGIVIVRYPMQNAYTAAVLADAPSLYFPFDETTGVDVVDAVGQTVTGTVYGANLNVSGTGNLPGAVEFDGVDDYIEFPYDSLFNPSTVMSYEFWIQPYSNGGGDGGNVICIANSGGVNNYWRIRVEADSDLLRFFTTLSPDAEVTNFSSFPYDNSWYHVVWVYDSTAQNPKIKVYINGVLIQTWSTSGTIDTASQPIRFGEDIEEYGENYHGKMAGVAIYNYELSPSQIHNHYRTAVDLNAYQELVSGKSPQHHWGLDEYEGGTINDYYGNAHGTETGMSVVLDNVAGDRMRSFPTQVDATIPSVTFPSEGSIEFWINDIEAPTASEYVFDTDGIQRSYFYWDNALGNFIANVNNWTGSDLSYSTWITPNAWTHVVLTWNSTTAKGYKNGVEVVSENITAGATESCNMFLGKRFSDTEYLIGASLDEIVIYDRVLTQSEIQEHHNAGPSTDPIQVTSNYSDVILADLPSAYFDFSEIAGVVVDEVNGLVGVVNGANLAVIPDFNLPGAIEFDGVNDYVEIPYHTALNPTTAGSYEFWIQPYSSGGGDGGNIIAIRGTGINTGWRIRTESSSNRLRWLSNVAGSVHPTVTNFPVFPYDNSWYHVVFTNDTAAPDPKVNIYINGNLVQSWNYTSSYATSSDPILFGAAIGQMGEAYHGKMAAIAVYNYALTPTQISEHYQIGIDSGDAFMPRVFRVYQGASLKDQILSHNPMAYWSFEETSGLAQDQSGNGYHTTVNPPNVDMTVQGPTGNGVGIDYASGEGIQFPTGFASMIDNQDFSIHFFARAISFPETSASGHTNAATVISFLGEKQFFICQADGTSVYNALGMRGDYTNAGWQTFVDTGPLNTHQWYQVVFTRDATTGQQICYVDGVQVDTGTIIDTVEGRVTENEIGGNSYGTGRTWNGDIAEVAIIPSVLTPTEVENLANAGVAWKLSALRHHDGTSFTSRPIRVYGSVV